MMASRWRCLTISGRRVLQVRILPRVSSQVEMRKKELWRHPRHDQTLQWSQLSQQTLLPEARRTQVTRHGNTRVTIEIFLFFCVQLRVQPEDFFGTFKHHFPQTQEPKIWRNLRVLTTGLKNTGITHPTCIIEANRGHIGITTIDVEQNFSSVRKVSHNF